jgi:hypothetical protein
VRAQARDGRLLAGAVVALFFVVLVSVNLATGSTPWHTVGVDARATAFEDMRSITSSWDCAHRGIDLFPRNPCDPLGRPENYPRIWTKLGVFGLDSGATTTLGVLTAVVFFLAALAVAGPLTLGEGAVYAATLVAPATLLGVERGNADLLMFALVALGVWLLRRSTWAGAAAITLAGVLKLFPALALAVLLRRRARLPALAASLLVLAVYAAVTLDDIRAILRVLPRGVVNSYGVLVLVDSMSNAGWSFARTSTETSLLRFGLLAAAALFAVGLLRRRRGRGGASDGERRLDAFWAGAAVYVGTYAFGNNFDYRLVFLILCVPQLCSWTRHHDAPAPWPGLTLAAIVATMWLSSVYPPLPFGLQTWYRGLSIPPEEILNWFLFAWLAAALASDAFAVLPRAGAPGLKELREQ